MISASLRHQVEERAGHCCEYCRFRAEDGFMRFEVDHVIAVKHDGPDSLDNLCLSCWNCNRFKGTDIATYDWDKQTIVPLFNPRTMQWNEHFILTGAHVSGLTSIGRGTVKLLQFNHPQIILRRAELIPIGLYPC